MRCLCCIFVFAVQISSLNCDENVSNYVADASNPGSSLDRRNKAIKNVVSALSPREVCKNPTGYQREIGEVEMMVADRKEALKSGSSKRNIYSKKPVRRNFPKKATDVESGEQEDISNDIEDQEEETNALNGENEEDDLPSGGSHIADENKDDVYVNDETDEVQAFDSMGDKEDSHIDRKKLHTSGGRSKQNIRGNIVKNLNDLKNDRGDNSAGDLDYSNSASEDKIDSLSDDTISDNEAKLPGNTLNENTVEDNDAIDTKKNLIEDNELDSAIKVVRSSLVKDIDQNDESVNGNVVGDTPENSHSEISKNRVIGDTVSGDNNVDTTNNRGENNVLSNDVELSRNILSEDTIAACAVENSMNSLTDDSIPDSADKDIKNSLSGDSISESANKNSKNGLNKDSIPENVDKIDQGSNLSQDSDSSDMDTVNTLSDNSIPEKVEKDPGNTISEDSDNTDKGTKSSLFEDSHTDYKDPGNSLSENSDNSDKDKTNSICEAHDITEKDSTKSLSVDSVLESVDKDKMNSPSDITNGDTINNISGDSILDSVPNSAAGVRQKRKAHDITEKDSKKSVSVDSVPESVDKDKMNSPSDITNDGTMNNLSGDSMLDSVVNSVDVVRQKRSDCPPAKAMGTACTSVRPPSGPKLIVIPAECTEETESIPKPAPCRMIEKPTGQRKKLKRPKNFNVQKLR